MLDEEEEEEELVVVAVIALNWVTRMNLFASSVGINWPSRDRGRRGEARTEAEERSAS